MELSIRHLWIPAATVLGLMLTGYWAGGPAAALVLPPILITHEAGHYLAMRRFGYSDIRLLCVPLIGAAVTGRYRGVADWQRAVVFLAGPLPSIAIGGVIGATGVSWDNALLWTAGLMTLGLNLINLLPLRPLDGGWIAYLAIFRGRPIAEAWFRIAVATAAASVAVWTLHPVAIVLAVIAFGSLAAGWLSVQEDPPTDRPLRWPVSAMVLFTYIKTVVAGGSLMAWLLMQTPAAAVRTAAPRDLPRDLPQTIVRTLDAGSLKYRIHFRPGSSPPRHDLVVGRFDDPLDADKAFGALFAAEHAVGQVGQIVYASVEEIAGVNLSRDDSTPQAYAAASLANERALRRAGDRVLQSAPGVARGFAFKTASFPTLAATFASDAIVDELMRAVDRSKGFGGMSFTPRPGGRVEVNFLPHGDAAESVHQIIGVLAAHHPVTVELRYPEVSLGCKAAHQNPIQPGDIFDQSDLVPTAGHRGGVAIRGDHRAQLDQQPAAGVQVSAGFVE